MTRKLVFIGLLLAAAAGCSETDPYSRPGMWQPEGANAGNMAAMVANPSDLVRGQAGQGVTRQSGEAAVLRLWLGAVKPEGSGAVPGAVTQQAPSKPVGG